MLCIVLTGGQKSFCISTTISAVVEAMLDQPAVSVRAGWGFGPKQPISHAVDGCVRCTMVAMAFTVRTS